MNVIEAIIYCLGFVNDKTEDGEYHSQTVFDKNGDPHWISWEEKHNEDATPRFCSESPMPFVKSLEPYRT